ncbi:MAG: Serine/threonine-protein kinase PknD [Myxococcota bacterium]|nr:Serine/threonine-protein kinase PknD [Myxococcota bacterium]
MGKRVFFGKYQLLGRISQGGMAEIVLARMRGVSGFEKLFAIKRILPQFCRDEEFLQMLVDEANIAAGLSHPNIVHIYELGQEGDYYFIAMEYVRGQDLYNLLRFARRREKPLPAADAVYIAIQICKALHYAHNFRNARGVPRPIVHRDVSPNNVLLSYDGDVKLADFGIARAEGKISKTNAGAIKGKFSYLSPEQTDGRPPDARSDLFSAGIVLWEMLAGRRLFDADDEMATLQLVRNCEIPPLKDEARGIDDALDAILRSALARNPEDRCPGAQELQTRLSGWLARHDPHYTERHLAGYLHELCAPEIQRLETRLRDIEAESDAGDVAGAGDINAAFEEDTLAPVGSYPVVSQPEGDPRNPPPAPSPTPAAGMAPAPLPAESLPFLGPVTATGTLPQPVEKRLPLGFAAVVVALAVAAALLAVKWAPPPVSDENAVVRAESLLMITSDPDKASIEINGERRGETPLLVGGLEQKVITVRLSKEGHETFTAAVDLKGKRQENLKAALPPLFATLKFTSDPKSAAVYLNEELKGQTPLTLDRLLPNRVYSYRLELNGHEAATGEARTAPRSQENIHAVLPKKSRAAGYLSIHTEPVARLFVDGRPVGDTPQFRMSLPPGKHRLMLQNPQFNIRKELEVVIEANKETRKSLTLYD